MQSVCLWISNFSIFLSSLRTYVYDVHNIVYLLQFPLIAYKFLTVLQKVSNSAHVFFKQVLFFERDMWSLFTLLWVALSCYTLFKFSSPLFLQMNRALSLIWSNCFVVRGYVTVTWHHFYSISSHLGLYCFLLPKRFLTLVCKAMGNAYCFLISKL